MPVHVTERDRAALVRLSADHKPSWSRRANGDAPERERQATSADAKSSATARVGTDSRDADPNDAPGARPIVRRSPDREVGIVNAPWLLDHGVEHESWLERNFIHTALASPVVTDVHHQPLSIELTLADGTTHSYTPDFRVRLADGTIVICEVKPAKFVKEFEALFTAAAAYLRQRGEHFMVINDHQIYHSSRSARAILLMRYGRLNFTPEQAEECKRILEEEMAGSTHVQKLVERGVSEDLVWHMVAKHMLRAKVPLNVNPLETVEVNDPMENCLDYFKRWFGTPDR